MNTKQILVVRKDLNMRKGKIASQACHASMAFLTKTIHMRNDYITIGDEKWFTCSNTINSEIRHWLDNSFRKICVYVNSEEELVAVHEKALAAGLISHLVEDNGATEFKGVKTKTCCAIGPAWDNQFEGITDHLPLL